MTPRRRIGFSLVAALLAVAVLAPSPAGALTPGYYSVPYDTVLYRHDHTAGGTSQRPASFAEWAGVGYPSPRSVPTDVVRYPWSPTLYAVSYFDDNWLWATLSAEQWQRAGSPAARTAGHIAGTVYYKWDTSSAIFSVAPDGVVHALTFQEWQGSGFRQPEVRRDTGYAKLSWNPGIARMVDVVTGRGYPIGYADWQAAGFPAPAVLHRFPQDVFCRYRGSDVIWYFGPSYSAGLTPDEWASAGRPYPTTC